MNLRKNLNWIDRVARLAVGVVCIYIGFVDTSIIGNQLVATLVGVFGVINIFAAASSFCPVYAACGVNTRDKADAGVEQNETKA